VGIALIRQYRENTALLLQSLRELPLSERLAGFVAPFIDIAQQGHQWCLAGMLASDFDSLDETLRKEVRHFFDLAEGWLADQARAYQPLMTEKEALANAQSAMALLEGAQLLARTHQDQQRMHNALKLFYALLGASPAKV
jgi:TetR/AcrR family transcriptional repressor of nem operon